MGDLSKNFSRHEFACKCGCGFDTVDTVLLWILQELSNHFNSPVLISSACRCPSHNFKSDGSENSQHLYGKAADFTVKGIPPEQVQEYLHLKYPAKYGIGLYYNFTHFDVRNHCATWSERNEFF